MIQPQAKRPDSHGPTSCRDKILLSPSQHPDQLKRSPNQFEAHHILS